MGDVCLGRDPTLPNGLTILKWSQAVGADDDDDDDF